MERKKKDFFLSLEWLAGEIPFWQKNKTLWKDLTELELIDEFENRTQDNGENYLNSFFFYFFLLKLMTFVAFK